VISINLELFKKCTRFENNFIVKLKILRRDNTIGNHFLTFLEILLVRVHVIYDDENRFLIFFSFLGLRVASAFGSSVLCGRSD